MQLYYCLIANLISADVQKVRLHFQIVIMASACMKQTDAFIFRLQEKICDTIIRKYTHVQKRILQQVSRICCTVAMCTDALQQKGPEFEFQPGVFMHGVFMFSLCMHWFPPQSKNKT